MTLVGKRGEMRRALVNHRFGEDVFKTPATQSLDSALE